jgi:hypothetical protein
VHVVENNKFPDMLLICWKYSARVEKLGMFDPSISTLETSIFV